MPTQLDPWNRLHFMKESPVEVERGKLQIARNRPDRSPQLLMLHGVLRNWRSFYSVLPELQSDMSIVAMDFRGHGGSTGCESYCVVDYVKDALHVLRQSHASGETGSQPSDHPCVIYGHSLGAMVALAVASIEPNRVRSLILEDPPFSTMGDHLCSLPLLRYFQGVEDCLRVERPHDLESMFEKFSNIEVGTSENGQPILVKDQRDATSRKFSAECLTRVDAEVLKPITSGCWLEGFELGHILGEVSCPVELLQADPQLGGMLTDDDANVVVTKLADQCRLTYFSNAGHSIHRSRPNEVIAIIRRLVSQKDG